MTTDQSEEIDMNDGTQFVVQYNYGEDVVLFMSVVEYFCLSGDRYDGSCFVLGMKTGRVHFYVRNVHS